MWGGVGGGEGIPYLIHWKVFWFLPCACYHPYSSCYKVDKKEEDICVRTIDYYSFIALQYCIIGMQYNLYICFFMSTTQMIPETKETARSSVSQPSAITNSIMRRNFPSLAGAMFLCVYFYGFLSICIEYDIYSFTWIREMFEN